MSSNHYQPNRRQILTGGVTAIAGMSLGGVFPLQRADAKILSLEPDDIEPEIDLIAETDAYVQTAISEASYLGKDLALFAIKFNQGRDIFIAAQQDLSDLDYDITINGSGLDIPIDLTSPPVTLAEFIEFEQINLQDLQHANLAFSDQAGVARKALAKLLAGLGVAEAADVFAELLSPELGQLGTAIAAKNWKLVGKILGVILRTIVSRPFLVLLGERLGVAKAGKIIAKMAGRFVPFLGWAIIIAQLIWAFGEEFI